MAPKKPFNWSLWAKMLGGGAVICVGGPAFTMWVMPTDEQLFQKYNPELQRKSLERRDERQKEFDDFVNNLKAAARSDKPIWAVQKEAAEKAKQGKIQESLQLQAEAKAMKEAIRKEAGLGEDSSR